MSTNIQPTTNNVVIGIIVLIIVIIIIIIIWSRKSKEECEIKIPDTEVKTPNPGEITLKFISDDDLWYSIVLMQNQAAIQEYKISAPDGQEISAVFNNLTPGPYVVRVWPVSTICGTPNSLFTESSVEVN